MPERRHLLAGLVVLAVAGSVILFGPLAWLLDEDRAATARAAAAEAIAAGDAAGAMEALSAAEAALQAAHGEDAAGPAASELARLRARSAIAAGDLVGGAAALGALLREEGATPGLRHEAAASLFNLAWGMRLEGAARDEWMPLAEEARQHFRLLAETAGGELAAAAARNLEATLRLQRMDLSELQGLPLPKDCKGCKNLSQRQRKQRQNPGRQPSSQPSEQKAQDARTEIREQHDRGANAGDTDTGGGS
jgi:hypothetical protein